jgi:hypothetical protein
LRCRRLPLTVAQVGAHEWFRQNLHVRVPPPPPTSTVHAHQAAFALPSSCCSKACDEELAFFRNLREGDVLCADADFEEKTLELSVNGAEFVHHFA